jgi:hypothetical protein
MDETWQWFHCTTHTYGAWLHWDARSFRTRHHREHIVGDYKNPPPPGTYEQQLARSRRLLKQPPVVVASAWRPVFGRALRDKLLELSAQLICLSMGHTHAHVLAKMPPGPVPRLWMGRAKVNANFKGKDQGWTGKLWAVRGKITPIKNRQHQLNTFDYILDHYKEGAWVWEFRMGPESPGAIAPGLS